MASPDNKLFINADNDVWLMDVSIARTSAPTTAGTGSFVLKDKAGTTISTGAITYSTANSSEALWYGVITSTTVTSTQVTLGKYYDLEITLNNGSGADDFRVIELKAAYRGTT